MDRLADLLRARTHSLHARAEKSGLVGEVLNGRGSRGGYALLLRNLLPAYRELEAGLERHCDEPALRAIAVPAVYRARALESDLRGLCGGAWQRSLPLLPSGLRYARRIAAAATGDGSRLVAHAYTRYLGDLNGGRILRRLLVRSMGLETDALSFYDYPGIPDLDRFARRYREAFDAAGEFVDADAVGEEAQVAFRLNIDVSEEVLRAVTRRVADAAG